MKIAIMGSGGVGGFFGAKLLQAGHDVSFVARGAHLTAMRERGLTIENATLGDTHLAPVKVTDDPATIGPVDFILFAVKLWDSEDAVRQIAPLFRPDTAILSLQNGVLKDDLLRRAFGERAVMGGVAYVASFIARPGVIGQTGKLQRIVIGEYDGSRSSRAETLVRSFSSVGVDAELSTDVRRAIWEKYVMLVGLSATTATMRVPIGKVREHPRARGFLLDILREATAVGRTLGVNLPEDYAEARLAFIDTLPSDMTSSMHHDLERGNPLEVEWLSGGVVKLAGDVGVPTPANRAVRDILAVHASGRAA